MRRAGAYRRDQLRLNSIPAIRVFNQWLVDGFKKNHLRIARRKVLGESAPKLSKTLHLPVVFQAKLELVRRMDIDDDRQPLRQDHVQRSIEIAQILGP